MPTQRSKETSRISYSNEIHPMSVKYSVWKVRVNFYELAYSLKNLTDLDDYLFLKLYLKNNN